MTYREELIAILGAAWNREESLDATLDRLLARLAQPGDAVIEAAAEAIYECEPIYEGGEYIDGFQVTPGGNLTWAQANECDHDHHARSKARAAWAAGMRKVMSNG